MKKIKISAIVLAKNQEEHLKECFKNLLWADEIVYIDTGSQTDAPIKLAKKFGANTYLCTNGSYDTWRNCGLENAKGDWILYVDHDERITLLLQKEILKIISKSSPYDAYVIPRKNIVLGKEMKYGGLWPDYVKRLYRKNTLKGWKGSLHEEPIYEGEFGKLSNAMIHLKHDNLSEMLEKTNKWSVIEAKLLYDAGHPRMVWWRFIRIMLTELWFRLIKQQGFRDGTEGVIYAFYQMWSKFVTYVKLWEMQMKKDK